MNGIFPSRLLALAWALALLASAPLSALAQTATATGGAAPRQPLRFRLLAPGVWYSLIAEHSDKALEVPLGAEAGDGAPLRQNAITGADNQLFRFDQVRSGFFRITVKSTGKVLEIKDNSMMDYARVVQADWTGADNQMFTLVQDTDGAFQIIVRSSGYAFDVLGGAGALADETPVMVYPPFAARNHKFRLVEAVAPTPDADADAARDRLP